MVSTVTPNARARLSARSTDGTMRPVSMAFTERRVMPASAARSACVRSRIARWTLRVLRSVLCSVASFIALLPVEVQEQDDGGDDAEHDGGSGHAAGDVRGIESRLGEEGEGEAERALPDEDDDERDAGGAEHVGTPPFILNGSLHLGRARIDA